MGFKEHNCFYKNLESMHSIIWLIIKIWFNLVSLKSKKDCYSEKIIAIKEESFCIKDIIHKKSKN